MIWIYFIVRTISGSVLIKDKSEEIEKVSISDIEQLFDAYDEQSIGFVTISHVKDRIKHYFNLSESIIYTFLCTLEQVADDEMLNRIEFHRLLKPFFTPSETKSQKNWFFIFHFWFWIFLFLFLLILFFEEIWNFIRFYFIFVLLVIFICKYRNQLFE